MHKQIEEENLKQVFKELKKTRSEDGNSFKTIFEVQDIQRFKKRFLNQRPSTTLRINKGKGYTPKPQERKGSNL